MPKLKTNRGAAKRFRARKSDSYKRKSSFRNHILTKKSTARKRQLRNNVVIKKCDQLSIKRMMCDK